MCRWSRSGPARRGRSARRSPRGWSCGSARRVLQPLEPAHEARSLPRGDGRLRDLATARAHEASATRTWEVPSLRSGIGPSCSPGLSTPRPARGRSNRCGAPGAAEHAAAEHPLVERRGASRTGVQVGQQRAVDVRHQQVASRRRRRRSARPPGGRLRPAPRASPRRAVRRRRRALRRVGAVAPWAPAEAACRKAAGVAGGSATPSTSSPRRSGAASISAFLIASSSVAEEAAQPSQLPLSLSVATPPSRLSSCTSPPWDSM